MAKNNLPGSLPGNGQTVVLLSGLMFLGLPGSFREVFREIVMELPGSFRGGSRKPVGGGGVGVPGGPRGDSLVVSAGGRGGGRGLTVVRILRFTSIAVRSQMQVTELRDIVPDLYQVDVAPAKKSLTRARTSAHKHAPKQIGLCCGNPSGINGGIFREAWFLQRLFLHRPSCSYGYLYYDV